MSEVYITRTCQACGGPLSMANECGTGESLLFQCPLCEKFTSPNEWISLPQASKRFDVPLPTLRYHAVRGHFEAHKPDKRTWLCEAQSVEEWVKGRRK